MVVVDRRSGSRSRSRGRVCGRRRRYLRRRSRSRNRDFRQDVLATTQADRLQMGMPVLSGCGSSIPST